MSNLPRNEAENRGRAVWDDRVFDAVDVWPPRLPLIRVADELDVLVGLVFDKFEGAGADRMAAHVARRDMAGIDRGIPRGEQCQECRLRPLQMKGRLSVAVGRGF